MQLDEIKILAGVVIILGIVKVAFILTQPHKWLNIVRAMHANPKVSSPLFLLLAGLVLFLLIKSGLSILQLLAVTLFVALLVMSALSPFAHSFLDWADKQDMKKILKQTWLYTLVWLVLMIWGVVEIFRT